jgi:protein-disulfide isomerase
MRLRLCRRFEVAVALMVVVVPSLGADEGSEPEPAPKVLRFVERVIAWYPDSTFRLVKNERYQTPSGSYRYVEVERTCASQILTGKSPVLVDENANTVWLGGIGQLPPIQEAGAEPEAMRTFLSTFLEDALEASMNLKIKVEWDLGPRQPGALMPLDLVIDTGYGSYRRRAAVTSDGKYVVMGDDMPLEEDPVAHRRQYLAANPFVLWDNGVGKDAKVEIVEFSDLECPACKSKWPIVHAVLAKNPSAIRHGLVSFPLTMIHPWAFRAACSSWCVAQQDPQALLPLKETFYDLQRDMEVELVTPTSVDFVNGHDLDETAFLDCYLRKPSIEAVHEQMSLGQEMGVRSTPTYFVNGWMVQVPDGMWFPAMVDRLLKGEEP